MKRKVALTVGFLEIYSVQKVKREGLVKKELMEGCQTDLKTRKNCEVHKTGQFYKGRITKNTPDKRKFSQNVKKAVVVRLGFSAG